MNKNILQIHQFGIPHTSLSSAILSIVFQVYNEFLYTEYEMTLVTKNTHIKANLQTDRNCRLLIHTIINYSLFINL